MHMTETDMWSSGDNCCLWVNEFYRRKNTLSAEADDLDITTIIANIHVAIPLNQCKQEAIEQFSYSKVIK